MARRFNYGGDEDRDDANQFYGQDDEDGTEVNVDPAFVAMMQTDLMSESLDQNLLAMAIAIAKDSSTWGTETLRKKLHMISQAYTTLSELMHPKDDEAPPEDE